MSNNFNKIISFSIKDGVTFDDSKVNNCEKNQFVKLHCKIYSADCVNDHNFKMSREVMEKYANTIAKKPILVWYNQYANLDGGDFGGHENDKINKECPVGFFPENVKIEYETDDTGTVFLCADGYVWNAYYPEIKTVFDAYGGVKGLSCEMYILDSEIEEETGIENILKYNFAGVTLLGEYDAQGHPIKPAVDGCRAILCKFAALNNDFENAKVEFEKTLINNVNSTNDRFDNECNHDVNSNDNTDNVSENDESNISDDEIKILKENFNKLREQYNKLHDKYDKLVEYKNEKEKEQMNTAIFRALNSVSQLLSSEQMDSWKEKAKSCTPGKVDAFINEIKAFAFDLSKQKNNSSSNSFRNQIARDNEAISASGDLWEKLSKKYRK